MNNIRLLSAATASVAAIAILLTNAAPLAGQGKGKGPQEYQMPEKAEIPRTAAGQPDLNGIWMRPYTPDMTAARGGNSTASELHFTEWGQEKWDNYDATDGDYAGACLPFGLIRSINAPHPMQIVQGDDHIAFLHEQNTWFTKVPTDGRPFPDDVDEWPTWFGTSVGHWEGDTLVIESRSFNGKTRLDTVGHPHSEQMTVLETWTLMNPDEVYYTIEITDPRTYTEPITSERTFRRDREAFLIEYSCEENNKSLFEGRIKLPDFEEWLR